jgi:DNA-binding response OmpR family regulator
MQRILVVEDEPTVSDVVARYLRRDGYSVGIAADGEEGLRRALEERPDLIVLDLMLPRLDGLEVCRRLRVTQQTPVIMLTARGDDGDAVLGLGLGADDYVTKPFSPNELMARVKAVLRRGAGNIAARPLSFGALRIDPQGRTVTIGERALDLTPREFDLLWHLASHPGQVLSREQLLAAVWHYDYYGDAGTVTVHVRRLREKLEPDPGNPHHLKTVWGIGYKFDPS